MSTKLTIIGGGLAGAEAAWQAAERGLKVTLYEMRPAKLTPAHKTGLLAELVCSNSLKADTLENASGLLKEELRSLNSLIMRCADSTKVPAGGALAVDRERFSEKITNFILNHPNIELVGEEIKELPNQPAVIATGPLTAGELAENIKNITGECFYFYDAAAPIVSKDSLNWDKVFKASRYDKGDKDYINCPMNKEEYEIFYHQLIEAERYPLKSFEKEIHFEGCMPVEAMAKRGPDTLVFGPLKPVGLIDPHSNKQPYAVVQLRQDNQEATLYNMVGFQTNLKWNEQKRVFSLIPGLEDADFVRYGVMHRNTFINSPLLLASSFQFKKKSELFFAGQITGVEGYLESTASGLTAGINAARLMQGLKPLSFPINTAIGALAQYITSANAKNFQPMNINFGLLPSLGIRIKNKKEKNRMLSERALAELAEFKKTHLLN